MAERQELPARRWGYSQEVRHVWGMATTQEVHEQMLLSVNCDVTFEPKEVFIEYGAGPHADRVIYLGHDVAVLISIALQYGVPLEAMRDSVARGEINYMGKIREVPHTIIGTVLDHMVAERAALRAALASPVDVLDEPARSNFPEIPESWLPSPGDPAPTPTGANSAPVGQAWALNGTTSRQFGFTGDQCTNCQSFRMVRNGSCLKCEVCGTTTGCS